MTRGGLASPPPGAKVSVDECVTRGVREAPMCGHRGRASDRAVQQSWPNDSWRIRRRGSRARNRGLVLADSYDREARSFGELLKLNLVGISLFGAPASAPGTQDFWVASAAGPGPQAPDLDLGGRRSSIIPSVLALVVATPRTPPACPAEALRYE